MTVDRKRAKGLGLDEGPKVWTGPNNQWIVIGVDYTLSAALKAYDGNAHAQALLRAVEDVQRTQEPPPPEFWRELIDGVNEPIRFINLGNAKDGSGEWLVVVDGRNRCMGAEPASDFLEAQGLPRLIVPGIELELPRDTDKAVHLVLTYKTRSAARVGMLPSHWAERAREWKARNLPLDAIGAKLLIAEGPNREHAVTQYLALAKCIQPIQTAINKGATRDLVWPVKGILKVAEMSDTDQAEWLENKLAPKGERKTRGYAVAANYLGAVARELDASKEEKALAKALTWLASPNPEAFAALSPAARSAFEKMGYNPKTGRFARVKE